MAKVSGIDARQSPSLPVVCVIRVKIHRDDGWRFLDVVTVSRDGRFVRIHEPDRENTLSTTGEYPAAITEGLQEDLARQHDEYWSTESGVAIYDYFPDNGRQWWNLPDGVRAAFEYAGAMM